MTLHYIHNSADKNSNFKAFTLIRGLLHILAASNNQIQTNFVEKKKIGYTFLCNVNIYANG